MKQQTNVKVVRLDSNDEKVILKVKVGNGDPSLTTIYRNGSKVTELKDPYSKYIIDSKNKLIGDDVLLTTSVHDLPGNSIGVTASHEFEDSSGKIIMISDFKIDVDEGDVAICSTQIYFLKM